MNTVDMPSPEAITKHALESIQAAGHLQLANAIKSGDRIDSCQPIIDWLASGKHPTLHMRQLCDGLLGELKTRNANHTLKHIFESALSLFLEDKSQDS